MHESVSAAKTSSTQDSSPTDSHHDAVIVGASLAGCAAAILLARAGARVVLVEQRPDPDAYKRICTHYIQSSAIDTLERIGLLEPMMRAGAVRSRGRLRMPWGWVAVPKESAVGSGINLRREVLDPMIREAAASTPGVELMLGYTVHELLRDGELICGAVARNSAGGELRLSSKLLVGADGRGSRVAKLAGVASKTVPHGRVAYGGYFEGPAPQGAPDASLWMLDPDMAAAFPTDSGLTFYAAMPIKAHADPFREDPEKALVEMISALPDAPPIAASRMVAPAQGKLDMTNVAHTPSAPGLALVGDAALAIDPLWGVGCGWALQSAGWLADSVAPALVGSEPLAGALKRYRRRHTRALRGHAMMIYDYTSGRKFSPVERLLFNSAVHDERLGAVMEAFGSRSIGPAQMLLRAVPLALRTTVRRSISRRGADQLGAIAPAGSDPSSRSL